MKEFRFRIIMILLAIAFSFYLLYPTYQDYQFTKKIDKVLAERTKEIKTSDPQITNQVLDRKIKLLEDSLKSADPSIAKARSKRIKLGLDLQGGMRVVLEVNTGKLLEKLAKNPDDVFKRVVKEAENEAKTSDESVVNIVARKMQQRGIRLSRYFGNIRQSDSDIIKELSKDSEDAVSRAMEIIRNRVDQYGVSEPSIQKQGDRRIIVELPGVAREEEAKQLLQGTALLEFKLLKDPQFTVSVMKKIDDVLAGEGVVDSAAAADTSSASADTSSNKQLTPQEFAKKHPFFSLAMLDPNGKSADAYVKADEKDRLQLLLNRPDVQNVIPNNCEFVFSAKPVAKQNGQDIYVLYCVNKTAELTGGVVTDAKANIDPQTSSPIVSMEMNSEGATDWARITGANVGKRCAIILDGVVYSAPVIRGKIPGGRSQIEGSADLEEAQLLAIVLKAGALPAPVDIIEERTVGPSLGQDSINSGFLSVIIGYILVGFFMILYYKRAGVIASAALILTLLFIMGVLAGFGATLNIARYRRYHLNDRYGRRCERTYLREN